MSDLQGPARPGDPCAVLSPKELTPARVPGPTSLCLGSLQISSPLHAALSARAGTPPARDTRSLDAAARDAKARAQTENPRDATPWVWLGPRRHPPSSSHPAASAGAGTSIPRGSPGRCRQLCRPHRRACAEPPRGAGPKPALTAAHAGLRLAG